MEVDRFGGRQTWEFCLDRVYFKKQSVDRKKVEGELNFRGEYVLTKILFFHE